MSAPKFTPGPWYWSANYPNGRGEPTWSLIGGGGYGVLSCDLPNSPQETNGANGPLIAASPELYEALVAMLDNACAASEILDNGINRIDCTQDEWDGHVKACELARAALAKAAP